MCSALHDYVCSFNRTVPEWTGQPHKKSSGWRSQSTTYSRFQAAQTKWTVSVAYLKNVVSFKILNIYIVKRVRLTIKIYIYIYILSIYLFVNDNTH